MANTIKVWNKHFNAVLRVNEDVNTASEQVTDKYGNVVHEEVFDASNLGASPLQYDSLFTYAQAMLNTVTRQNGKAWNR